MFGLDPLWRADLPAAPRHDAEGFGTGTKLAPAKRSGKRHAKDGDATGRDTGRELRRNMRKYSILSIS